MTYVYFIGHSYGNPSVDTTIGVCLSAASAKKTLARLKRGDGPLVRGWNRGTEGYYVRRLKVLGAQQ